MTATSTIALSLRMIRAGRPAAAWPTSRSTRSRNRDAQAVRRDEQAPERPLARQPGQDVEQVGDVGADLRPAGQQAEVDVLPGRPRVVVAGPDVDVAAKPGALAPDDERRLGVRLEPDQPVHDVRPGALELARPDDVGLLVEAGLDLDQDDDLLAALGGPDERLDDRRVARRPVQRLLDGQDVRVVGRLGDEPLGRWPRTTRTGGGRGCRPARIAAKTSAGSSSSGGRSRGGVTGDHGTGLRSGRSSSAIAHRPVRSSMPLTS